MASKYLHFGDKLLFSFLIKLLYLLKKKSTLNVIIEWHWDNIDDKYYTIVYIDGNVIMTVINV